MICCGSALAARDLAGIFLEDVVTDEDLAVADEWANGSANARQIGGQAD
jgi:hypothetical protein